MKRFAAPGKRMNIWAVGAGIGIAMLSFIYGFRAWFAGMNQASARGYRHMVGLATGLYILINFTFLSSLSRLFEQWKWTDGMPPMIAMFVISGPSAGMGLYSVGFILPTRTKRSAPGSKAHVPFSVLAAALLILVPLFSIAGYFTGTLTGYLTLRVMFLGVSVALYLFGLGRKSHAPNARDVLQNDKRPPVLYLRAFSREKDVFAKVAYDGQEHVDRPAAEWRYRTVEEFLRREIREAIGSFVALGSPLDYVPPDGAARLYSSDKEWPLPFVELGEAAQIILIAPHYSKYLELELLCAQQAGWLHKIRVITRPTLQLNWRERFWWRVSGWIAGPAHGDRIAPHDWNAFLRALQSAGVAADDSAGPPAAGQHPAAQSRPPPAHCARRSHQRGRVHSGAGGRA
jgi:hypothetical protein